MSLAVLLSGLIPGPVRAGEETGLAMSDSALAAPCTYVVDADLAASSPGSSQFKTIQEAVTALPDPGPCTIDIKAGTYTEAVLLDRVNSAAWARSRFNGRDSSP